jgi:hypothetical protein
MDIKWSDDIRSKFEEVTDTLPQFHRTIAKQLVKATAEELAQKRGSALVEISDLVKAFFKEVPPAFKDMMKRLLSQHNIDYAKYMEEEG